MNLNNLIFLDRFPTLDLHGFDRQTARVAITDFIKENEKLKQPIIVIIHGVGSGILRQQTKEVLKKNKNVLEYKTDYFNHGCTIVRIKI